MDLQAGWNDTVSKGKESQEAWPGSRADEASESDLGRPSNASGAKLSYAESIAKRLPPGDHGTPLQTGLVKTMTAPERQSHDIAEMAISEEESTPTSDSTSQQQALSSPAVEVKSLSLNLDAPSFTPKANLQSPWADGAPEKPRDQVTDTGPPDQSPFMQDLLDRRVLNVPVALPPKLT